VKFTSELRDATCQCR